MHGICWSRKYVKLVHAYENSHCVTVRCQIYAGKVSTSNFSLGGCAKVFPFFPSENNVVCFLFGEVYLSGRFSKIKIHIKVSLVQVLFVANNCIVIDYSNY